MTDNFNFKQFLAENKLGAYSKAGKLNESWDPRTDWNDEPLTDDGDNNGDGDGDESGQERDLEEAKPWKVGQTYHEGKVVKAEKGVLVTFDNGEQHFYVVDPYNKENWMQVDVNTSQEREEPEYVSDYSKRRAAEK